MTIVYMYDRQYIPYPSPSSSSSSLLPYSPSLLPWNSSPPSLDYVFLSERPAISTSPVFIPIWKVTLLTNIEGSNWLMGLVTKGHLTSGQAYKELTTIFFFAPAGQTSPYQNTYIIFSQPVCLATPRSPHIQESSTSTGWSTKTSLHSPKGPGSELRQSMRYSIPSTHISSLSTQTQLYPPTAQAARVVPG